MRDESVDAILGDLEEEYAIRARGGGGTGARLWYWKEATLMLLHAGCHSIGLAVLGGAVAGAMTLLIGRSFTRGPLELFPYALLILTFIACSQRFVNRVLRLMVVFVGILTSLLTTFFGLFLLDPHVTTIPLSGIAWRLEFIVALAAVISLSASEIAPRVPSRPYPFALAMGVFGSGALWATMLTRRFILLPLVFALLLLATKVYLKRQRIERFSQRFMVALIVCTVITGLAWLFFIFSTNRAEGVRAWAHLFQGGLLYLEIIVVSIVVAGLTKTERSRLQGLVR